MLVLLPLLARLNNRVIGWRAVIAHKTDKISHYGYPLHYAKYKLKKARKAVRRYHVRVSSIS